MEDLEEKYQQLYNYWDLETRKVVDSHMEKSFVFPERLPEAGDEKSELMCAGFNEYRSMVLETLKK